MMHLIVLPVVLPALTAAAILVALRYRLFAARLVSMGSSVVTLLGALALWWREQGSGTEVYAMGNWQAPFGIVLVLDSLSAMLLVLVATLALVTLIYAVTSEVDKKGRHFHSLFHFQVVGLSGAFLTGDLFNLFVFFEVLLIASYGLMLHGQGSARLKAGLHYVIVNVVGSTIFLIALGILYGMTGTLNMADMAQRIAAAPASDHALLRVGGLLLFAVFALKAALVPLHLWLPRTYSSTSAPVAALLVMMTKVGVYGIIRVSTLIFGASAGGAGWAHGSWMLPAALLTVFLGFVGVVAARGLREMTAFAVVGSTGTLLTAVALGDVAATSAALYYLAHSTLAGATLFLVSDLVARGRLGYSDALVPGPRFSRIELVSVLFFLSAMATVGLPPLSGFIGKLLILQAASSHLQAEWVWGTLLFTSFIALLAFARAGSVIFWKSAEGGEDAHSAAAPTLERRAFAAPVSLLALLMLLTLFAGPATSHTRGIATQLFSPQGYIEAVLGSGVQGK